MASLSGDTTSTPLNVGLFATFVALVTASAVSVSLLSSPAFAVSVVWAVPASVFPVAVSVFPPHASISDAIATAAVRCIGYSFMMFVIMMGYYSEYSSSSMAAPL